MGNRCRDPESNIRQNLRILKGMGRKKNCRSQWWQGHHKNTHRTNYPGLIAVHRDWQAGTWDLYTYKCKLGLRMRFLGLRVGDISDFVACFCDPALLPDCLILPNLIATWYAMVVWYSKDTDLYLKKNSGGGVDVESWDREDFDGGCLFVAGCPDLK